MLNSKELMINKRMNFESQYRIIQGDCLKHLSDGVIKNVDLTFVDPPFNQGKAYKYFNDSQPEETYWSWLRKILRETYSITTDGGAIYFMQREKNAEYVTKTLRESGWTFQNLIIWKKMTSAVPSKYRYSKQHQIIVFATKGKKPRVFNRLRIDPPKAAHHKYERENGIYVTDIWDDIRELTSGYFAGDEALRNGKGERMHKQQSPIKLLARIILSSTNVGDLVFDPFAGTGSTLIVSKQLQRSSLGIELDCENVSVIRKRLDTIRNADKIEKFRHKYNCTENLDNIWPLYKQNYKQKIIQNVLSSNKIESNQT